MKYGTTVGILDDLCKRTAEDVAIVIMPRVRIPGCTSSSDKMLLLQTATRTCTQIHLTLVNSAVITSH